MAAWAQSTAYSLGAVVTDGPRTYRCITAGTSSSSGTGPSATSGTQGDGTVTWRYLGAATGPRRVAEVGSDARVTSLPALHASDHASGGADDATASLASVARMTAAETAIAALGGGSGDAVTELWYPAKEFDQTAASGAATFTTFASRISGWSFPNATNNNLGRIVKIPSTWATFYVTMVWTNLIGGSGVVVWAAACLNLAAGDSFNTAPTPSVSKNCTADSTQYLIKEDTLGSPSALTDTPSKYTLLRITRSGTTGTDTLAGAAGLLGVKLSKAS